MINTARNTAHMKVEKLFFSLERNYSWNHAFYQSSQNHVFRILESFRFLFLDTKDTSRYEQQANNLATVGSFWTRMTSAFWFRFFCFLQEG